MSKKQKTGFILGPLSAILIIIFFEFDPANPLIEFMAAVAVLMAVWWITEPIPLGATSLLPLVLFPLFGILDGEKTAETYINSTIFLFLGGFLIALAMEKWNLHKRIALKIIMFFGGSAELIILGFMCASAFLSMWISNTATAVMMLPIGLAVIKNLENEVGNGKSNNFSKAIMIGIAYSCSIGGVATLIGTPPNLSFARIFKITFPSAPEITFGNWLLLGIPVTVIMLFVAWIVLTKIIYKFDKNVLIQKSIVQNEFKELGKTRYEEKIVLTVFILTALLWIFRSNIEIGSFVIPGWANLFGNPKFLNDGVVAIAMATVLFLFPSKNEEIKSKMILDNKIFSKVPWDIILLFGGGFALAKGFVVSGLAPYIGEQFSTLTDVNPFLLMFVTAISITFLTELTSNTATTEMILPVLASISVAIGVNPLLLMITATFSASMAFMLPVATPPNAVVFASQRLNVSDMIKSGIILNLTGVFVITLVVYFIGTAVFDINLTTLPEWIK